VNNIPPEIVEQFRDGFNSEASLMQAIRLYLRTPEHKSVLDALDISIEDILNGRVEGGNPPQVKEILTSWNYRLGFQAFVGGEVP
jgi:hypothetical protein